MSEFEKAYTTKEVSEFLDIGTSTVRKWCIALEENGYSFNRTDSNKRLYVEHDLVALKHFKQLVKDHNFSLSNASDVVTAKFKGNASESRTPAVPGEKEDDKRSLMRSEIVIEKLMKYIETQNEFIKSQEKFNKELLDRLDQQQDYIEERLKERDKHLLESVREIQETKKMLAAAEEKRSREKGIFSRIFGR